MNSETSREYNRQELVEAGAAARAAGRTFLSNPFLKLDTLPAYNTGVTIEEWARKHDAWHLGWVIEDAMRS